MANMVYANPFGSMVEGAHAGLQDTLTAANAARDLRAKDNAYDFLKWYVQPAQKEQLNTETGLEKLKALAALSHYTGDYSLFNNAAAQYFGINPENLPKYAPGQQQRGVDYAAGLMPIPLANSDIQSAGGVQRFSPGKAAAINQPLSPEYAAIQDTLVKYLTNSLNNPQQPAAALRNPYQIPTIEEGFPTKPAAPATNAVPQQTQGNSLMDNINKALMSISGSAAPSLPAQTAPTTAPLKIPAALPNYLQQQPASFPGLNNDMGDVEESTGEESQSSVPKYKQKHRPELDIFGQQTGQAQPTQVFA